MNDNTPYENTLLIIYLNYFKSIECTFAVKCTALAHEINDMALILYRWFLHLNTNAAVRKSVWN